MLENTTWRFYEMVPINRMSDGRIKFQYHYLKDATEAEVREYTNLEADSKPLVDACELFTPVEQNFKWLTDITNDKSVVDYKGKSYSELDDRVAVQAGNYISSIQALIEHWKSFVDSHMSREVVLGDKVGDLFKYMKQSMSTRALIKALRNYLMHHARLPLCCGQESDPDTGKINFFVWVNKRELLRNSHFHADDKAAIEEMPDFFDLLPILKTSREEVEKLQFFMYKIILLSKEALTLRDRARFMQKQLGLVGCDFFLIKSSGTFPANSKIPGFFRPTMRLEYIQLSWGLIQLIDQFDAGSKIVIAQE